MQHTRRMALGALYFEFGGDTPGSWRDESSASYTGNDIQYYVELAQDAEKACLDFIFLADIPAVMNGLPGALGFGDSTATRLDPIMTIGAVAMATSRIGLAATASTTFYEPYNLARLFMSADHISGGRVAWNVVTSDKDEAGPNFGLPGLPDRRSRYARSSEFLDVVLQLWDSWQPDALTVDRTSGALYDPSEVKPIDHHGEYFDVAGPLNISRSPQGHPVIAQAGSSEEGRELAARAGEVIFSAYADPATSKAYHDDVKGRMAKYGRDPSEMKILEGILINVAETEELATARMQHLIDTVSPAVGLHALTGFLGQADFSHLDYDAPVPESAIPTEYAGSKALFDGVADLLRQGRTLREVVGMHMQQGGGLSISGDPTMVADFLEHRFNAGCSDGFILQFPILPLGQTEFTRLVVPELQRRGLFRTEYEAATLRENLGLPVV